MSNLMYEILDFENMGKFQGSHVIFLLFLPLFYHPLDCDVQFMQFLFSFIAQFAIK